MVEMAFEVIILIITVVSLVLLVIPYVDIEGFPNTTLNIFSWVDLYISYNYLYIELVLL